MAVPNNENQTMVLDRLFQLIDEKFDKEESHVIKEFARLFCGSIAHDDLSKRALDDVIAPILSVWDFLASMPKSFKQVSVFNPDLETCGWYSNHTVIELVYPDMPFLVDSVRMELNRMGVNIHLHCHIPLSVQMDSDKKAGNKITHLQAINQFKTGHQITPMYIEIDRQATSEHLDEIKQNLERVLEDVCITVDAWEPMKERLHSAIDAVESMSLDVVTEETRDEAIEFLKWVAANHFTFLSYIEYQKVENADGNLMQPVAESFLGLATSERWQPEAYLLEELPKGAQRLILDNSHLMILTKLSDVSSVHRPAHIDYIGIKRLDKAGNVVGEDRFLGLYTSAAYNMNPMSIPVLRQKIQAVHDCTGLSPGSHDSKVLRNILETHPRDELFQVTVPDLLGTAMGILHIKERSIIRLFIRRDPYGRFFSCLIYVPRELYTTKLRLKLTRILSNKLQANNEVKFTTTFSESILARIQLNVPVENAELVDYDLQAIEEELKQASLSWDDGLKDALILEHGEATGLMLAKQYCDALPSGYKDQTIPKSAVLDITHIEKLSDKEQLSMLLYRSQKDRAGMLKLKLFHWNEPIPLSEVLPMMENMGLKILDETPYHVKVDNKMECWIMDFSMLYLNNHVELKIEKIRDEFQDAFFQIWKGACENDALNRLVLCAGINWRDIVILRAYTRYLKQIGVTFGQRFIAKTLVKHFEVARQLVLYFAKKFSPKFQCDAEELNEIKTNILQALEKISNIDEDKILERLLRLMEATVRTNFYQVDESGQVKSYVSFKLKPKEIPEIPLPAPLFEIFVYSPKVEGVHLRFGKVARGGLRWSDRQEDFRTEILGLVKAQQVKNTVIVPVGSKGGFVCKQMPQTQDRGELMKEGIACYQIFIKGLLDITDNYVDDKVVSPENVVRRDADDPYLVVAADKGTATFSDIANEISVNKGFWLGDAFASGGSIGYDHKKMGITAKGAWESVKRHFMEMGHDTQTQDFTVVGIGDMAGDVFGNGMLLSQHICLVGAFNHMHIFIDPTPNSKQSWQERKRLFELPGSTWEDYDTSLISKGGGIFSRSLKSIPLSPEMKSLLGVEHENLSPNELIQYLLKSKFDLLWNGGIGTYVKSEIEHHNDVGDRANDALRINGSELQCRVIGEGGNLGLTQLGRIEYMRQGGRGNTDFIDNAAGVNCSDHEVNIKVLLNQCVAQGKLTVEQRNEFFLNMTDEVGEMVLYENFRQAQSISVREERAPYIVKEQMRFIHALEKENKLDRALEFLPNDEALLERFSQNEGLSRAELSVLLAYGKMELKEALLNSEFDKEPFFESYLVNYFPKDVQAQFADDIHQHPLRKEIIATKLVNEMVDYMGSNFVYRIIDETGESAKDIAICFVLSKEIFSMTELWNAIEALGHSVPTKLQYYMIYQTQRMVRRCTRWLLRHRRKSLSIADGVAYFHDGVVELWNEVSDCLEENESKLLDKKVNDMAQQGVPKELASKIVYLSTIFSALDIVELSKTTYLPIKLVAEVFYKLGAELELHWFLDQIISQPVDNHWQAFARASLREDLDWHQRSLTLTVLQAKGNNTSASELIASWLNEQSDLLNRWNHMTADFRSNSSHEFAKFSVTLRELLILVQNSARRVSDQNENRIIE